MIIAFDFDGTVVDHHYPAIGPEAPDAVRTLRDLVDAKHKLVLFTVRSGRSLSEAVEWLQEKGVQLWGIQYNPDQVRYIASNKAYANLYIDDSGFGCPRIKPKDFLRPCVNWMSVRRAFRLDEQKREETK